MRRAQAVLTGPVTRMTVLRKPALGAGRLPALSAASMRGADSPGGRHGLIHPDSSFGGGTRRIAAGRPLRGMTDVADGDDRGQSDEQATASADTMTAWSRLTTTGGADGAGGRWQFVEPTTHRPVPKLPDSHVLPWSGDGRSSQTSQAATSARPEVSSEHPPTLAAIPRDTARKPPFLRRSPPAGSRAKASRAV